MTNYAIISLWNNGKKSDRVMVRTISRYGWNDDDYTVPISLSAI